MNETDFEKLVSRAYESIPLKWRQRMTNVGLCIEDRDPEDPDLLGVYEGVALTERGSDPTGLLPDKITLFRATILEEAEDTDGDAYRVVRETLIHEIAHHFGWSDEQIEAVFEARWERDI